MSQGFAWPEGCRGAVSLTYDDGLACHHDLVAPLLSGLGLTGTFYVPIINGGGDLLGNVDIWKAVVQAGHELGNHTIFHPCRRGETMAWLDEWRDLKAYTLDRLRDELRLANYVLKSIDGLDERTFGNTCCHTTVGRDDQIEPMDPVLNELFIGSRGRVTQQPLQITSDIDWTHIGCISGDGKSLEQLQATVRETLACGGWSVFMFHGVGEGTHRLFIEKQTHDAFLEWLAKEPKTCWTRSAVEVTRFVRARVGKTDGEEM